MTHRNQIVYQQQQCCIIEVSKHPSDTWTPSGRCSSGRCARIQPETRTASAQPSGPTAPSTAPSPRQPSPSGPRVWTRSLPQRTPYAPSPPLPKPALSRPLWLPSGTEARSAAALRMQHGIAVSLHCQGLPCCHAEMLQLCVRLHSKISQMPTRLSFC